MLIDFFLIYIYLIMAGISQGVGFRFELAEAGFSSHIASDVSLPCLARYNAML